MRESLFDVTRLVDRTMQRRRPTGVDRVSLEYIRHFGDGGSALVRFAGQWIELCETDSAQLFAALLSPASDFNIMVRRFVIKAFARSVGRRFSEPRFFFNTGHNGLEKPEYAQFLQRSALKPLYFVHDLIPLSHPEYCRPGEAGRHRARMKTMLSTGQGVIANSTATLAEFSAYAQSIGVPVPPTAVALLAPAQLPQPTALRPLDVPYFVMLGTIEPRKNHWLMLQLWRQLIERLGTAAPRLVIIGQRGWLCDNVIDMLERCEVLRGFVFQKTGCSDAELASWLGHSQALLFPTFAEGYGMPLAEALALGVPVIASDLPAFREIADDIPEYVDPLDGRRWAELVEEYARPQSQMRSTQCQKMATFSLPTWEAHFQQVEALMEQLRVAEKH